MNEMQAWFHNSQSQMASELESLCNICSGSDHLPGLLNVASWLKQYLADLEWESREYNLPTWSVVDDSGVRTEQQTHKALRWDWDGEQTTNATPRMLMSIHYDTVYGVNSPFQKCTRFSVDGDERMRGPGVIDAKGGIVVMKWALLGAMKFLDKKRLRISVILTPDEEIGSPATKSLWQAVAPEFSFAMLYEPTLPDGSFVSERKGTGTFTVIVHGKAAHAGRNFDAGRNAILHASKIAVAINELNGVHKGVTVNIGRIRGGDAVNVVPDLCVMRVNVRVTNAMEQKWIEAEMARIQKEWDKPELGFRVEVEGGIFAQPKTIDDSVMPWIKRTEAVAKSIGESVLWKPSGGASDGNKLAALGLPNVDTFGPEGDLLHSDQEWVRLSSLPRKAHLSCKMLQSMFE
ncbi:MAG: hydrolase [Pirellula sp.]|jgi:glutamate carboxypeptidase|nr:hydrolase [Pirellula sp.]